jgi:DUF3016 family protein
MKLRPFVTGFLPALALAAASAQAAVVVSFVEPDRYTDSGNQSWDRETNLRELEQYLQKLGDKYLAPNQTLRIEVLDVDLAGWPRFGGRAPNEVRIMRGRADFPAMRMRYTLESPAGRAETREETVDDTGYLDHGLRVGSSESLYYEKRMLEKWFKTRFADGARR